MTQRERLPLGGSGAASGPLADGYALATAVYGECSPQSGFLAFAYLWRRFGPPRFGSDDHKALAGYVLGTPHPEVWLTVAPSGSALPLAVGYLVTHAVQRTADAPRAAWEETFETWWWTQKATAADREALSAFREKGDAPTLLSAASSHFWEDRMSRAVLDEAEALIGRPPHPDQSAARCLVEDALTAALRELLRPVFVRDVAITILGRIADEALGEETPAAPSRYAGLGVPKAAMDALRKEA